jgi:hypothetical protein
MQTDAIARANTSSRQRFSRRDDGFVQAAIGDRVVRLWPEDRGTIWLPLGRFVECPVQVHNDCGQKIMLRSIRLHRPLHNTTHRAAAALPTASPIDQQQPTTRAEACANASADKHLPAAHRLTNPWTWSARSGIS